MMADPIPPNGTAEVSEEELLDVDDLASIYYQPFYFPSFELGS